MLFNCWSRSFTAIEHCVPTCFRCGTAILGIWLSTNWTPIGWSSKRADFGWNNRCFHNSRKCEFYPWCLSEHFLKLLIYFGFHSSSSFLSCQILSKKTPMQEQEPNSPLNDPVSVEGDSVDSPTQHATDGKEVICPFYSSVIIMN